MSYTDAALGNEAGMRSRYGYCVSIGGCVVAWKTKCSSMVCLSTAEAEFVAATEAAKDVLWFRGILDELSLLPSDASAVFEDNQACVRMIQNQSVSARNRHFCIKMHWLREQVSNGRVVFHHVTSADNTADIFTKVLPAGTFLRLRAKLLSYE